MAESVASVPIVSEKTHLTRHAACRIDSSFSVALGRICSVSAVHIAWCISKNDYISWKTGLLPPRAKNAVKFEAYHRWPYLGELGDSLKVGGLSRAITRGIFLLTHFTLYLPIALELPLVGILTCTYVMKHWDAF